MGRFRQVTLRSLLLGTALIAIGCAILNRKCVEIREESAAAQFSNDRGGVVLFDVGDWRWLRRLCGNRGVAVSANFYECDVTDRDLPTIAKMRRLRMLSLEGTQISDDVLKHLSGLSDLEEVSLARTRITGKTLGNLRSCPNLVWLSLSGSRIGDESLSALCEVRSLDTLDLSGTEITDRGVKRLAKLPRLRILNISGTRVKDVEAVRKALPGRRIMMQY